MQHDLFGNGTPPPASNGNAQHNQRSGPYPPFHHNAPKGTSDVAAARIALHTPKQRERIYQAIHAAGEHGLTDDEGEEQLGIIPQSYTPRRRELLVMGVVRDSGNRRMTRNGRSAAVWVAVDQRTQQPPD